MRLTRTLRRILSISSLAVLPIVGASCVNEANVSPANALDGSWTYVRADSSDLTGYNIGYTFDAGTLKYHIGDAGEKDYAYSASGANIEATLERNTTNSDEPIGGSLRMQYRIAGDSLYVTSAGHTGVLVRE